jgi:hypothetical protein
MPLLDHFHPPLSPSRHWESFHVNWAGAIADTLNETLLPEGYFAEEHAQIGPRVEIDVATFANADPSGRQPGGTVTLSSRVWSPPAPTLVVPAAFADAFEVLIFESAGGSRLVAAIELISPGNKDRAIHRNAFAVKIASYLCRGISVIVIDIVTSRRENLHNPIMELLGHGPASQLGPEMPLYAVAYRPVVRDQGEQIEIWPETLEIGQKLPILPLALDAEQCLPIDLETTYTVACQRRRLA